MIFYQDVCAKIIEKTVIKESQILTLTSLKLSNPPDFQRFVSYLQNITELDLSNNHLFNNDQLFQTISLLSQLKILNLSNNYLNGNLSLNASKLIKLEYINLNINQFTCILPESIAAWLNIKTFSIADNSIITLPNECINWKLIENINLKNNKIIDINPILFDSWNNLKKITMSQNLIKRIPDEIGNCKELREIDFSK